MKKRTDGWYQADEGNHFVLTTKGQQESASYRNRVVGEPVSEYDIEASSSSVEQGHLIEVPIPNWIEKEGYRVMYEYKGNMLSVGNSCVFPEREIAEKYKANCTLVTDKELLILTDVYKGIRPSPNLRLYNEKPVYDSTWFFGISALAVGDYVVEKIVCDMMDLLPPVCECSNCSQIGEPHSHRVDEKNGKTRPTYATFKKIAHDIWEYCGDCFCGENKMRGKKLPYV